MEITDYFLREAKSRSWSSLDELNAWLAEETGRHNSSPQDELGGLSPDQARRLLGGDWETQGPLTLNASLQLDDLRSARFVTSARGFLSAMGEAGSVKATSAGNLNRKFVAEMLERLELEYEWLEILQNYRRVINEEDVFPLHALRVVLDVAGLIKRRSGKFSLTRKGSSLLKEESAGALYAHLFWTFFQRFNLAYLDGCPPNPALQSTLPVTLYRIGREGGHWARPRALADRSLHPAAFGRAFDWNDEDYAYFQFELRIVRPLVGFGLMERRDIPSEKPHRHEFETRKSVLFDRFLQFEF